MSLPEQRAMPHTHTRTNPCAHSFSLLSLQTCCVLLVMSKRNMPIKSRFNPFHCTLSTKCQKPELLCSSLWDMKYENTAFTIMLRCNTSKGQNSSTWLSEVSVRIYCNVESKESFTKMHPLRYSQRVRLLPYTVVKVVLVIRCLVLCLTDCSLETLNGLNGQTRKNFRGL